MSDKKTAKDLAFTHYKKGKSPDWVKTKYNLTDSDLSDLEERLMDTKSGLTKEPELEQKVDLDQLKLEKLENITDIVMRLSFLNTAQGETLLNLSNKLSEKVAEESDIIECCLEVFSKSNDNPTLALAEALLDNFLIIKK